MTIFYVSKDGNDNNNGTEINPWLTIQKAADTLVAGDTVYIKAGTYNECVLIKNSGTPNNYITFTHYQTDAVILNKSCGIGISNADWSAGFWIKNKSWIKIIGFMLIDCYSGVHADTASNIIITNNYIQNPIQSAIKIGWGYSSNITIEKNLVIRTNGTAWQEMISVSNGHNVEVKNNYVMQNNKGEGIDFKDGTSDSSIHHNLVENTYAVGIYIDSYSSIPSSNIDVYGNIVHDAGFGAATGAYIMGNEYGELTTNVKFFNNIAYNSYIGFGLGYYGYLGHVPQYKDVYFINNTSYNNGNRNFLFGMVGTNIVIRNNIGYKGTPYSGEGQIHTVDHNSWDIFPGQDPKFINESSYDFHLKSDSPAINKGSSINAPSTDFDGIIRPQGTGYDIGAYEYVPCNQPQCNFLCT